MSLPREDIQALRLALDAGPTEGPFFVFNDGVYRAEDEGLEHPLIHVMTSRFTEDSDGMLVASDAAWFAAVAPDRIRRLLDALEASGLRGEK